MLPLRKRRVKLKSLHLKNNNGGTSDIVTEAPPLLIINRFLIKEIQVLYELFLGLHPQPNVLF